MERGYAICQHCGAHLPIDTIEDYYEWYEPESIGWVYTCPNCGEENYKEITFGKS